MDQRYPFHQIACLLLGSAALLVSLPLSATTPKKSKFRSSQYESLEPSSPLPIGERKYIIDARRPDALIKIVPKNQLVEYEYLGDPIMPGERTKAMKPKPIPKKPVRVQKVVRFQESEIGLRAMKISGRQASPRVKFVADETQLSPVQESLEQDYLEQLLDSPRTGGM